MIPQAPIFVTYTGDGTTVAFHFDKRIYLAADLQVWTYTPGVDTVPQLVTIGYTVAVDNDFNGAVATFAVAPAVGVKVGLIRRMDLTQDIAISNTNYVPPSIIEQQMDRQVMMAQEAARFSTLGLETDPFDFTKTARANAVPMYDANGNPTIGPLATDVQNAQTNAAAAAASASAASTSATASASSAASSLASYNATVAAIAALGNPLVFQGAWDASAGTFPGGGAAKAGYEYIVTVAGTVGGVVFNVDDVIIALTNNASTTVYAANWYRLQSDMVTSVAGLTGAITAAGLRHSLATAVYVANVAALQALDTTKDTVSILTQGGRTGHFVWTLGNFSSQIAADTLQGVYIKSSAIAATVGAWVRVTKVLYPDFFGGVSDWTGTTGTSTDNAAALQAMITIAAIANMPMQLLGGPGYMCNSTLTATNMDFILDGLSISAGRIVFNVAGDGLVISQDTFEHATFVKDLTLTTVLQEPGAALKVTYSTADCTNNRNQSRCNLHDLDIRGEVMTSHGWLDGIVIQDVHRCNIVRPAVTGRRNLTFSDVRSYNNMRYGIRIIGSTGAIPADIQIAEPRLDTMQEGVHSEGEVEGVIIDRPVMVGVVCGVRTRYTSLRPWTQVRGGHVNCFQFAVDLANNPQANIADLVVYKIQFTLTDTIAILLTTGDFSTVNNIRLQNQCSDASVSGQWHGVQVASSSFVTVDGVLHERGSTTVAISGTSTTCETRNLRPVGVYTNATIVPYSDTSSGANVRLGGGRKVFSGGNAAVTATASPTLIVTSGSLSVNKGERYRITGFINTTKGATLGEFLTTINFSGTATAVFGSARSSILERTAQAASATVAHSVSGVLEVTASGTLTISMNGTATGANSDVLANDGQLNVDMI